MNNVSTKDALARDEILQGESLLKDKLDVLAEAGYQTDFTDNVTHHHAQGVYGREFRVAADTLIFGKIHKQEHICILLKGDITVTGEGGKYSLSAPAIWVTPPGTKRVVFHHTDVIFVTIHPTDETDVAKIEEEVIAPSFKAYDNFIELQNKSFPKRLLIHGKQFFRKFKTDQVSLEKL